MNKEQLKIKEEIETTYNRGMNIGASIEIINPDAFKINETGNISGHIYNLCAFGRLKEVSTTRFKACIINALIARGIEVYKSENRGGVVLVKDTNGRWHELYRCDGMARDPRGIQIFADTSFEYWPKETDDLNKKVCVVRRGGSYRETAKIFFDRILDPIVLDEKKLKEV